MSPVSLVSVASSTLAYVTQVELTRSVESDTPIDPCLTLSELGRGTGDPAYRSSGGIVWRCTRTPEGPATLRLRGRPRWRAVDAAAWGTGARWVLDRLPELVGARDDRSGFEPGLAMLERLARRFAGWRVCRTGQVLEALIPAVLEQKVTNTEAWRSWRELLWRFGERAPGPTPVRMWVPPDARTWAGIPSWGWHRAGVDPRRARTVVACARAAARLEETLELPAAEADRRFRAVPGVGAWTVAEVRQRAHGDPDAVSVGDFHLAKNVGWALAGRRFDDEAMLSVLERWRGHRYRVTRLIELGGHVAPRRGPRLSPRDYRDL